VPKIAVVIPARYASTRFPGKPLFPIAGKPLIQHVWERCKEAAEIDEVIIATDDMRIAEVCFGFGADIALTPADCESGTDRVAAVAKKLRGYSHIINVQGDEPLIDPDTITGIAQVLSSSAEIEMITAASLIKSQLILKNPNVVKVVVDENSDALYFSRAPIPFVRSAGIKCNAYRHHGIYGYTRKFLLQFVKWKPAVLEQAECLEQLRALHHGTRIRVIETNDSGIGVDTPADARKAKPLIEKFLRRKRTAVASKKQRRS